MDIPSKAQMFQRMCAATSEWIPHLHIIQCIKCWSWGWAHVLVILVTIGDVSAESEHSVYLGERPYSMVLFSDCPQGYLSTLRELSS